MLVNGRVCGLRRVRVFLGSSAYEEGTGSSLFDSSSLGAKQRFNRGCLRPITAAQPNRWFKLSEVSRFAPKLSLTFNFTGEQ